MPRKFRGKKDFDKIVPPNADDVQEAIDSATTDSYRCEEVKPLYEADEDINSLYLPQEYMPESRGLSAYETNRLKRLLTIKRRRRYEALRIYEPMPHQLAYHLSNARERICVGSNRGGKTLCTMVEVAWAVTGQHPYNKYYPKTNGKMCIAGFDLSHLGRVIFPMLFRPGAFDMIRDLRTLDYRTFRPNDPADKAREDECIPCDPLIPPRMVKSIAWENKAMGQPRKVVLHTGWEIDFFSSEGKPPQGNNYHACLAGWSKVFDPVADRERRIDEIDGPFHVDSYNETTGEFEVREASKPFIKGYGELCRVTFNNGDEIYTTRAHRVLTTAGWHTVEDAMQNKLQMLSPVGDILPGCFIDFIETVQKYGAAIWDISVPGNENYVYGPTISHNSMFDEEMKNAEWYKEISMRLGKRRGLFTWSATPHVGGEALLDLHQRAEKQINDANPRVAEFSFLLDKNQFFDDDEKLLMAEKLENDPEAYRVRILGQYAAHGLLVYPEFHMDRHGMDLSELPGEAVPHDWTRYTVTDPGRQKCATLFLAVPPPEYELNGKKMVGDFVLIYDELGISQCDAYKYGEQMERKTRSQSFDTPLIDLKGSQSHDTGSGEQIAEQYWRALKTNGVLDRFRVKSFIPGESDKASGIESVRAWLRSQRSGKPYVRILRGHAPGLESDLRNQPYLKKNGSISDVPNTTKYHFSDCLRYLAGFQPRYRKPKPIIVKKTWRDKALEKYNKRRKQGKMVSFGPGQR